MCDQLVRWFVIYFLLDSFVFNLNDIPLFPVNLHLVIYGAIYPTSPGFNLQRVIHHTA